MESGLWLWSMDGGSGWGVVAMVDGGRGSVGEGRGGG